MESMRTMEASEDQPGSMEDVAVQIKKRIAGEFPKESMEVLEGKKSKIEGLGDAEGTMKRDVGRIRDCQVDFGGVEFGNQFLALNGDEMPVVNGRAIPKAAMSRHEAVGAGDANIIPDVDSNAATAEQLEIERAKCQHEVCLPHGSQKDDGSWFSLPTAKSAKQFSFPLDPFQNVSIACLERRESVLVSAHTSAGKTVVAQYAIAMALRDKQRVIYTSPIKALSNQKYRDLAQEFGDVGLMTGDTTLSTEASCLVMTTEILRSMLYRSSELLKEVSWVIYDEIHYMRDKERGVVWEETLILLPDSVRFVFLSATIPNARQFASWISRLHDQPCHVVYTEYRPIPLQHYFFPSGGQSLHLVVDETGRFREPAFNAALSAVTFREEVQRKMLQLKDTTRIVTMVLERHYEPVIVFTFSRKSCEVLASKLTKDFNTVEEHKTIALIFQNAIDTLGEEDRKLPQVSHILPLLQRGIGVHHSGLLPLLKEVIEILFQEGLIKVLFATETFSIGLNMPAKTVVFTALRKFDGDSFRWISGGEYIQMSGRAGRRGIDNRGIVIVMLDEKMDPAVARRMVKGSADVLNSSFHIKYNMLLNTIRMEGMDPETMLRRSFRQFQHDQERPGLEDELGVLQSQLESIPVGEGDAEYSEYFSLNSQIKTLKKELRTMIIQSVYILPFLIPGRLIKISQSDTKWDWGVLVNYQCRKGEENEQKRRDSKGRNRSGGAIVTGVVGCGGEGGGGASMGQKSVEDSSQYILDILLYCKADSRENPRPAREEEGGEFIVVPVMLNLVKSISQLRLKLPRDLRSDESRMGVYRSLMETRRRFPGGLPLLDPVEDMGIRDERCKELVEKLSVAEAKMRSNFVYLNRGKEEEVSERCKLYGKVVGLEGRIRALRGKLDDYDEVILSTELKCMKKVLHRLGYIDSENVIQIKGQVACEINAADELVLTELIFSGFFNQLSESKVAAMLSCFVFQEKAEEPLLPEDLAGLYNQLCDVVKKVGTVEKECKLPTDPDEYVGKFQSALVQVFHEWAQGASFLRICKLTTVFEGSIVRALRRLEELLRQLMVAAKSIGNTELEEKFSKTVDVIKRDVAFTVSLYL